MSDISNLDISQTETLFSSTNVPHLISFQSQLIAPLIISVTEAKNLGVISTSLFFSHLIFWGIILILLSNKYRIWLLFNTFVVYILFQDTILSLLGITKVSTCSIKA